MCNHFFESDVIGMIRKLHTKPHFLVTTEAYLSALFGPNISNFFDLCLQCVRSQNIKRGYK